MRSPPVSRLYEGPPCYIKPKWPIDSLHHPFPEPFPKSQIAALPKVNMEMAVVYGGNYGTNVCFPRNGTTNEPKESYLGPPSAKPESMDRFVQQYHPPFLLLSKPC